MTIIPSVLLVDDSHADVKLTLHALRDLRQGHEITVVRDGAEALDYVLGDEHGVERPPLQALRLILLDLKLPKVSGLEVLRSVKSNPQTQSIPIVILTSSKQESDIRACYSLGANGYVQKPVDFDAFRDVIRDIEKYWLRVNLPPPRRSEHKKEN